MSDLVSKIKEIYAAFWTGDVAAILGSVTDDVSWEFEAPAEISWGGNRRGPAEAAGFFSGICRGTYRSSVEDDRVLATEDASGSFRRYDATLRATGVRVRHACGPLLQVSRRQNRSIHQHH